MTLCNVSGTRTRRMREVSSVDAHTVRALSRIARDPSPARHVGGPSSSTSHAASEWARSWKRSPPYCGAAVRVLFTQHSEPTENLPQRSKSCLGLIRCAAAGHVSAERCQAAEQRNGKQARVVGGELSCRDASPSRSSVGASHHR